MLNEFIDRILVHESDRKSSTQTTQEIELYFNFVGRFIPPVFGKAELPPAELDSASERIARTGSIRTT